MSLTTVLTERLGLRHPIVLAPLGGGPGTVELAAAVSEAGGLGSLAAGYLGPDQLREQLVALAARTARPVAVNVFAPEHPAADPDVIAAALDAVNPLRAELGLPPLAGLPAGDGADTLERVVEVLAAHRPAVVSVTFGLLPEEARRHLAGSGCALMATATTVAEAVAAERAGYDAVCAQGAEAGGHRGSFLDDVGLVGTVALVPQVCDAVTVPVVAAGGIADGRGVAAALALGAAGAQLGTAFLRCPEAGTAAAHRAALDAADETATVVTDHVTGRAVRALRNRLVDALEPLAGPSYPLLHALTAELRREAARRGDASLMGMWAGQAAPLGRAVPAATVVADVVAGAEAVLGRLTPRAGA